MGVLALLKKALPRRKPAQNPQGALLAVMNAQMMGAAHYRDRFSGYKAEQIKKNLIAFRCINKIGSAVQSVPWEVQIDEQASTADQKAAKDKKQDFTDLLAAPCNLSGSALKYWMGCVFALFGTIPLKIGVSGRRVSSIYPLRPDMLSRTVSDFGDVIGYTYGDKQQAQSFKAFVSREPNQPYGIEIRKEDIFLSVNGTLNPLEALELPAAILDNLLERAYDMSDGTPNLHNIVYSSQPISAATESSINGDIEDRQVGGANKSGLLFLQAVDLKLLPIDNGLGDLHTKIPMDDMSKQVILSFGIPIALMGGAGQDGSKFASNYAESRLSFWEDLIIPEYLAPIEQTLSAQLCPPGLKIRFDREAIPALLDKRIAAAAQLETITFLTADEKRAIIGYDKLPAEKAAK